MTTTDLAPILMSAAMAVAAGLVGCFAVMRRMSLAADALSHVALPGIGVALALGIHPLFGAAAMLFFGALIVWGVENRTRIPTETVIGVLFATALAIGSMITRGEELIDALFGQRSAVTLPELVFGAASAVAVVAFVLSQRHRLVVAMISPDIARTAGINVRRLNLIYLEMFALTVALGLRYLGVLLMGALVIIPAATAKRLSRRLSEMLAIAAVMAVAATLGGTWTASWLHRETGPMIVTIAAAMFVATLAWRPRND